MTSKFWQILSIYFSPVLTPHIFEFAFCTFSFIKLSCHIEMGTLSSLPRKWTFKINYENQKQDEVKLCINYFIVSCSVLKRFTELVSAKELQLMLLDRQAFWNFGVLRRIFYRNLLTGSPVLKPLSDQITMVSTVLCDLTLSTWRYHVSCLWSHMWFLNDSSLSRSV